MVLDDRPGAVGISLVGTRRPGRPRTPQAAAPVTRAQSYSPPVPPWSAPSDRASSEDVAVPGACVVTTVSDGSLRGGRLPAEVMGEKQGRAGQAPYDGCDEPSAAAGFPLCG